MVYLSISVINTCSCKLFDIRIVYSNFPFLDEFYGTNVYHWNETMLPYTRYEWVFLIIRGILDGCYSMRVID